MATNWQTGNTLALVDLIHRATWSNGQKPLFNSHLVGAARQLGIPEDEIADALDSDRMLTIYEP
jgi:hypothetical protein